MADLTTCYTINSPLNRKQHTT